VKPLLCDTHAHLSDGAFDDDREAVARDDLQSGLGFIIDVGTNDETMEVSRSLCTTVDGVYRTVGYHPHDATDVEPDSVAACISRHWCERTVAVGEIGLDYHYDFSPRERQRVVFEAQLDVAAKRSVPVVIHIREAFDDAHAILEKSALPAGGVVHCFTGSYEEARSFLDLGLHVSFTGVLAFPRSTDLRETFARLPLDRVFFETDSPYLTPPPFRGKRNRPAHVRYIAQAAAAAIDTEFDSLIASTTRAAISLFRLDEKGVQ